MSRDPSVPTRARAARPSRPSVLAAALALALAAAGCDLTGPDSPTVFRVPLEGVAGEDWFYGALPNHAEGQDGHEDYACGRKTYLSQLGTDFLIPSFRDMDAGVAVLAAADGVVTETEDGHPDRHLDGFPERAGNRVRIRHADGYETVYRRLKAGSLRVAEGDDVAAGQPIAEAGSSGDSAWPGLRFEVRSPDGRVLDPWTGPCGGPTSFWLDQPPYPDAFALIDAGTTGPVDAFADLAHRPPDVTAFAPGDTLVFWANVLNRPAGRLTIRLLAPGRVDSVAAEFPDPDPDNTLLAGSVTLGADAEPGEWAIELAMDGATFARLEFGVAGEAGKARPGFSASLLDFDTAMIPAR